MRRLREWARKDSNRRRLLVMGVAFGGTCLEFLLEETHTRLEALEERGLVPIDDLATVGDLGKLEGRIKTLEGTTSEQA
jgi:hypothetical protein